MLPAGITPLSEAPLHRSFLIYGPPGTGKTWLAIQLAMKLRKSKRILVADLDNKLAASIKDMPGIDKSLLDVWLPTASISGARQIGIARIEMMEGRGDSRRVVSGTEGYVPPDPQGYREITTFFNSLLAIPPEEFPYDVVLMDTLTSMSEHLEALILKHHKLSTFTLQLFGVYKRNMIEWKGGFMSLPCHRIVTAHMNEKEDEDTKEVRVRPSIVGSYRDEIAKDFTEVYYTVGKQQNTRIIRTVANRRYIARTALPGLKDEEDIDLVLKALSS